MDQCTPTIDKARVHGRLWEEFERLAAIETDECVIWPYAKNSKGYGRVRRPGSISSDPTVRTHVEVCIRHHGSRPEGMQVAHLPVICHQPACMNYRHLRWASHAENELDKALDGVVARRGPRQGTPRKLNEDQVREIRLSHLRGEAVNALARQYGVSWRMVNRIINRQVWRHVV